MVCRVLCRAYHYASEKFMQGVSAGVPAVARVRAPRTSVFPETVLFQKRKNEILRTYRVYSRYDQFSSQRHGIVWGEGKAAAAIGKSSYHILVCKINMHHRKIPRHECTSVC